jgi:hypothetical protein
MIYISVVSSFFRIDPVVTITRRTQDGLADHAGTCVCDAVWRVVQYKEVEASMSLASVHTKHVSNVISPATSLYLRCGIDGERTPASNSG